MKYAFIDLNHSDEYKKSDEEDVIFEDSLFKLEDFLKQVELSSSCILLLEDVSKSIKDAFNGGILFSIDLIDNKILSYTYRYLSHSNDKAKVHGICETKFQFIFDISNTTVIPIIFKNEDFLEIDFPVRPSVLLSMMPKDRVLCRRQEVDAILENELLKHLPSNTVTSAELIKKYQQEFE